MNRRLFLALTAAFAAPLRARAEAPVFTFPSIDGGVLNSADWLGFPVLVVNTASLCGFTPQLEGMQRLYDSHAARGLVVLATPSNDFNQELDDAKKVKEFCTIQYGITLPMTDIIHVASGDVHPFWRWVAEMADFVPNWNFNKVLLNPQGQIAATWRSRTEPGAAEVLAAIEPMLPR